MTTVAELKPTLLLLPEAEREELATFLVASLSDDDPEWDAEGIAEAERRSSEMDADPGCIITHEEFTAHFRKRLGR